jgi:hypothetical protein
MTARAEVTGLAGISQQEIVAALIAVDERKAMMQVTAGHESFEHLALDGSVDESGCVEFVDGVAVSAGQAMDQTVEMIE